MITDKDAVAEVLAELLGGGKLANLSKDAIVYAQRLRIIDQERLAARLYFYNRLPLSERWVSKWPSYTRILNYLDIEDTMNGQPQAIAGGFRPTQLDTNSPWVYWRRYSPKINSADLRTAIFKLYVSPVPHDVRSMFKAVAMCLASSDAISFKVGASASGLLRPDKAVVYFDNYVALEAFSKQLLPHVSNLRSQGVPFSSQLDDRGLLSWAIDPVWSKSRIGEKSWRQWICSRLASFIVETSHTTSHEVEPWKLAVLKAHFSGFDTRNWLLKD